MKIGQFIFVGIIYSIIITPAVYLLADEAFNKPDGFMILFWNTDSGDIDEGIKNLTYTQLMEKFKPLDMLTDKYILKYYWDEQLLEIDQERYRNETGIWIIGSSSRFFTIVLNGKIMYHGISRTILPSFKQKYDDSNYPAITILAKKTNDTTILALKPKLNPFTTFKEFDKKKQKRILNQEVLEYFEKEGKIVRGKNDLNVILGYQAIPGT